MSKIEPFSPRPHGIARVDDRRVISGIVCLSPLKLGHYNVAKRGAYDGEEALFG
jgi:hypothetical protein